MERNLAKIFREKVKVFGTVQFTQVGGPAVLKPPLLGDPAVAVPN